jgi:hypothetical protein
MTVAKEPGHRGEHEAAVKTIARGKPDDSGVPVVTNARAYYTTRAAAGALDTRLSLRSVIGGTRFLHQLGRVAPRESGCMLFVVPALSRDPYAAAAVLRDAVGRLSRNNPGLWLWVPAQGRDDSLFCRDIFASLVSTPRKGGAREKGAIAAGAQTPWLCQFQKDFCSTVRWLTVAALAEL